MNRILPTFRYHSDPMKSGVFIESKKTCPICACVTGIEYVGPVYSFEDVEGICPWCIKNGLAAEKYDLTFVDEDEIELVEDTHLTEELIKRTPGCFFPQDDCWPSKNGDYYSYLGGVDLVRKNIDILQPQLNVIVTHLQISNDELTKALNSEHSPLWFLVFQCLDSKALKVVADYE